MHAEIPPRRFIRERHRRSQRQPSLRLKKNAQADTSSLSHRRPGVMITMPRRGRWHRASAAFRRVPARASDDGRFLTQSNHAEMPPLRCLKYVATASRIQLRKYSMRCEESGEESGSHRLSRRITTFST